MAATNPGFTIPLGRVRTTTGDVLPLYISQEWQIFLQALFERSSVESFNRIGVLETLTGLQSTLIDDASSRAQQAATATRQVRAQFTSRLKEIEFLGAFRE